MIDLLYQHRVDPNVPSEDVAGTVAHMQSTPDPEAVLPACEELRTLFARARVERKSFGFRLNVQLIQKLKIEVINQQRAANVLMEEAVEDQLKKYQKKGK